MNAMRKLSQQENKDVDSEEIDFDQEIEETVEENCIKDTKEITETLFRTENIILECENTNENLRTADQSRKASRKEKDLISGIIDTTASNNKIEIKIDDSNVGSTANVSPGNANANKVKPEILFHMNKDLVVEFKVPDSDELEAESEAFSEISSQRSENGKFNIIYAIYSIYEIFIVKFKILNGGFIIINFIYLI